MAHWVTWYLLPATTSSISQDSLTLSCTRRSLRGVLFLSDTKTSSSYVLFLLPFPNYLTHSFPSQSENVLTAPEITSVRNAHKSHLESGLSTIDSYVPKASMLERQWTGMVWPASAEAEFNPETGVERERLVKVGRTSVKVPEDFVSIFGLCVWMSGCG